MSWLILEYIQHLFYLGHRKGHGIHSPYVFEFINGVVFNTMQWQVPDQPLRVHKVMRKDCSLIPRNEPPGEVADGNDTRSISSFVKKASVSFKYGALLYRISHWFEAESVVELGSGLGISTAYLRAGSPKSSFHSVEGGRIRALLAAQVIYRSKLEKVNIHQGDIGEELPGILAESSGRLLAYVDGNHHYEPTLVYLEQLVKHAGEEAVIIMDDIYWSRGMQKAWKEVISWPEVRVSIDLFHVGILLLRSDLDKANIKMMF